MYPTNELLFGKFPRYVGTPNQFVCWDEHHFDTFRARADGNYNVYSSIAKLEEGGFEVDKVYLDIDSPNKNANGSDTERLNDDPHAILDPVVEDARKIAEFLQEENIPAVGVFSGMGLHVHALFKPRQEPRRAMKSIGHWIKDGADAGNVDTVPFGDVRRLVRVANVRRYDNDEDRALNLYTIPLSVGEMRELTVNELLSWSAEPRTPDGIPTDADRPDMERKDGYDVSTSDGDKQQVREFEITSVNNDDAEALIDELVPLPCMRQRIKGNEPHHKVRMNTAVMLFNAGLRVDEVFRIFQNLNWADWDPAITREQLNQIYNRGYSDMSCEGLQENGYCVFPQDERTSECEVYGWEGGQKEY